MAKKLRADVLLFESGLAESREKAKRLIMAGQVFAHGPGGRERVDKPGTQLAPTTAIEVEGAQRYISRGGHKLETAIEAFGLDFSGAVALDAGASTGGFTDCLLQHGAVRVYAVDVGTNQLHEKLKADPRVVNLEQTNLRHAEAGLIPEPVDLITADVSFISLTLVLPPAVAFLRPGGLVVALVKPQFELQAGEVGKGVVRDEALRQKAVDKVVAFCKDELHLDPGGVVPSQLKGPKGNQEYLALFRLPPQ